jgi:hypothetical protein
MFGLLNMQSFPRNVLDLHAPTLRTNAFLAAMGGDSVEHGWVFKPGNFSRQSSVSLSGQSRRSSDSGSSFQRGPPGIPPSSVPSRSWTDVGELSKRFRRNSGATGSAGSVSVYLGSRKGCLVGAHVVQE